MAGLKLEYEANEQVSNSFEISSPGQTLTIRLYLRQDPSDTYLESGLTSATFDVWLDDAGIAQFASAEPNPAWSGSSLIVVDEVDKDSAAALLVSGFDDEGHVIPLCPIENRILLATFTVKGISPGQTLLSAQEFDKTTVPPIVDFTNGLGLLSTLSSITR